MHRATARPGNSLSFSIFIRLSLSLEHALLRNNEGIYFINTGYPPRGIVLSDGEGKWEKTSGARGGGGWVRRVTRKSYGRPWLTCHFTDCLLVFHERLWWTARERPSSNHHRPKGNPILVRVPRHGKGRVFCGTAKSKESLLGFSLDAWWKIKSNATSLFATWMRSRAKKSKKFKSLSLIKILNK